MLKEMESHKLGCGVLRLSALAGLVGAALACGLMAGYSHAANGQATASSDMALAGQPSAALLGSWTAPPFAKFKKNPIPESASSIAAGHTIFTDNCEACHGANGKGDGPTASCLNPPPANLTAAAVWKQGEGAIYWKITNGHSPMPAFGQSLTKAQRWNVINYMHKNFDPAGH